MIYKDGRIYTGQWKNGLKHGKGIMKLPNEDEYEGNWDNDEISGIGKIVLILQSHMQSKRVRNILEIQLMMYRMDMV